MIDKTKRHKNHFFHMLPCLDDPIAMYIFLNVVFVRINVATKKMNSHVRQEKCKIKLPIHPTIEPRSSWQASPLISH